MKSKKETTTTTQTEPKAKVTTRFDVRRGMLRVCKMVGDTVVDEARYSEPVKAAGDVTILKVNS